MPIFLPLTDWVGVYLALAVVVLMAAGAVAMEVMIRRLRRALINTTLCDKRCGQGGCQLLASTDAPDPRPETPPATWTRWEA